MYVHTYLSKCTLSVSTRTRACNEFIIDMQTNFFMNYVNARDALEILNYVTVGKREKHESARWEPKKKLSLNMRVQFYSAIYIYSSTLCYAEEFELCIVAGGQCEID